MVIGLVYIFIYALVLINIVARAQTSQPKLFLSTNVLNASVEVSIFFEALRTLDQSDVFLINLPKFHVKTGNEGDKIQLLITPSVQFEAYWLNGQYSSLDPYADSKIAMYVKEGFRIEAHENVLITILETNGVTAHCGFPSSVVYFSASYIGTSITLPSVQVGSSMEQLLAATTNQLPFSYFPGMGVGCSHIGDCSGHGTCDYCAESCECHNGYGSLTDVVTNGRDLSRSCTARVCPSGKAIADVATDVYTAHGLGECSNRGTCNRRTGTCSCFAPFTGDACNIMSCPSRVVGSDCSGHGTCKTMAQLAESQNGVVATVNVYGTIDEINNTAWDAHIMKGCVCSSSWAVGFAANQWQLGEYFGADCGSRRCPSGDDPFTCRDEQNCEGRRQPSITGTNEVGQQGNLCHVECSNRGICNRNTGVCTCFNGSTGVSCNTATSEVEVTDCSPSRQPTPEPTATTYPSSMPSVVPQSFPTSQPTGGAYLPTNILSVNLANISRTWITVHVQLKNTGVVYCAAYGTNKTSTNLVNYPLNTEDILRFEIFDITTTGHSFVTIEGLVPATLYNIYCASVSDMGVVSDYAVSMATVLKAMKTDCCRDVSIDMVVHSMYQYSYEAVGVVVTMPFLPLGYVTATAHVHSSTDDTIAEGIVLYPPAFNFTEGSGFITQKIGLEAVTPGDYYITVSLSGSAAHLYLLTLPPLLSVEVLDLSALPSVPYLLSAIFSDDGASITIFFDSATNRGDLENYFSCDVLLNCVGCVDSECHWISDTSLGMLPSIDVELNGDIAVVGDSVYAKCPVNVLSSSCLLMDAVDESVSISIDSPLSPIPPVVVLLTPDVQLACVSLTLDLTMSSGFSGRDWGSAAFDVYSSDPLENTTDIRQYLNNVYEIVPPKALPAGMLNENIQYTFVATLCNFLSACTSATSTVFVSPSGFKVHGTILGSSNIFITRKQELLLNTDAYLLSCNSSRVSYSNLSYVWSLKETNEFDHQVPYTQINPAKFLVPSYSLKSNTWYGIEVVVTNIDNGKFASDSITVTVTPGLLVAVISGGNQLAVHQSSPLLLDGSASYDEDDLNNLGSDLSGIMFSWNCIRVQPTFENVCPFEVSDLTIPRNDSIFIDASLANLDVVARLTLTMFDSSRSSEYVTLVMVAEASVPLVSLEVLESPISTRRNVQINGNVTTAVECTAVWSVSPMLNPPLSTVAFTHATLEMVVNPSDAVTMLFLSLQPFALRDRTEYTFSLTCGFTSAVITITTSGPPRYGSFDVTPSSGIAVSTEFSMLASDWYSEFIPLTYLFAFISPYDATMVTKGQSEVSYSTTVLPDGNISCKVTVLDPFGAFVEATQIVSVYESKSTVSNTEISQYLIEALNNNTANIDGSQGVISTVSVLLISVECDTVPDCDVLNRISCSSESFSCGECKDGYYEETGTKNSLCVSSATGAQMSYSELHNGTCIVDEHCPSSLDVCVDGLCELPSKTCVNSCFNSGNCSFYHVSTGISLDECFSGNTTCSTRCLCEEGYAGMYCEESVANQTEIIAIYDTLVSALHDLAAESTATEPVVNSLVSSMQTITADSSVLSEQSTGLLLDTVYRSMAAASDLNMEYETVSDIFTILDTITEQSINLGVLPADEDRLLITDTLDLFANSILQRSVPGEDPFVVLGSVSKVQIKSFLANTEDRNMRVQIPRSEFDVLFNVSASEVILQSDGSVSGSSVSVVENRISSYGAQVEYPFNSNPVRVTGGTNVNISANVTFVMQNARKVIYPVVAIDRVFNTTCFAGVYSNHSYYCYEGYNITHRCSGVKGVYSSICPTRHYKPSCNAVSGTTLKGTDGCEILSFDDSSVTCSCPFPAIAETENSLLNISDVSTNVTNRRKLAGLTGGISPLEIVTITNFRVEEFATDFIIGTLPTVYLVAQMFAALWIAGVLLVVFNFFGYHQSNLHFDKKVKQSAPVNPYDNLVQYMESILPDIYLETSANSIFKKVTGEIRKHHRYISVLTFAETGPQHLDKITKCLKITTSISFVLFFMTGFSLLDHPVDDETCGYFDDEDACLHRTSPFDSSKSYCTWTSGVVTEGKTVEFCAYRNDIVSPQTVAIGVLIVSFLSIILQYPLNYCFAILASPFKNYNDVHASQLVSPLASPAKGIKEEKSPRKSMLANVQVPNDRRKSMLGGFAVVPAEGEGGQRSALFARVEPKAALNRRQSLLEHNSCSSNQRDAKDSKEAQATFQKFDFKRRETRRNNMKIFANHQVVPFPSSSSGGGDVNGENKVTPFDENAEVMSPSAMLESSNVLPSMMIHSRIEEDDEFEDSEDEEEVEWSDSDDEESTDHEFDDIIEESSEIVDPLSDEKYDLVFNLLDELQEKEKNDSTFEEPSQISDKVESVSDIGEKEKEEGHEYDHIFAVLTNDEHVEEPPVESPSHHKEDALPVASPALDLLREQLQNNTLTSGAEEAESKVGLVRHDERMNSPEVMFEQLFRDIQTQYLLLKTDAERKKFLHDWNVGLSTEDHGRSTRHSTYYLCQFNRPDADIILRSEIEKVELLAFHKAKSLELSSEVDTGMEIFRLFVLDLLGRDSVISGIFLSKLNEDFKEAHPVSLFHKLCIGLLLLTLTVFCVGSTVLWGIERDFVWQRNLLVLCIVQLVIDICLYETGVCLWVNFFIPSLIIPDVDKVIQVIKDVLHQITNTEPACWDDSFVDDSVDYAPIGFKEKFSQEKKTPVYVNVPSYMFVSSLVAREFPDVLESVIVQTYESCVPGAKLASKLRSASATSGWSYGQRSFVDVLKASGSFSSDFQRFVVSFLEVCLMGSILIVVKYGLMYPLYALACAVLLLTITGIVRVAGVVKAYWGRRKVGVEVVVSDAETVDVEKANVQSDMDADFVYYDDDESSCDSSEIKAHTSGSTAGDQPADDDTAMQVLQEWWAAPDDAYLERLLDELSDVDDNLGDETEQERVERLAHKAWILKVRKAAFDLELSANEHRDAGDVMGDDQTVLDIHRDLSSSFLDNSHSLDSSDDDVYDIALRSKKFLQPSIKSPPSAARKLSTPMSGLDGVDKVQDHQMSVAASVAESASRLSEEEESYASIDAAAYDSESDEEHAEDLLYYGEMLLDNNHDVNVHRQTAPLVASVASGTLSPVTIHDSIPADFFQPIGYSTAASATNLLDDEDEGGEEPIHEVDVDHSVEQWLYDEPVDPLMSHFMASIDEIDEDIVGGTGDIPLDSPPFVDVEGSQFSYERANGMVDVIEEEFGSYVSIDHEPPIQQLQEHEEDPKYWQQQMDLFKSLHETDDDIGGQLILDDSVNMTKPSVDDILQSMNNSMDGQPFAPFASAEDSTDDATSVPAAFPQSDSRVQIPNARAAGSIMAVESFVEDASCSVAVDSPSISLPMSGVKVPDVVVSDTYTEDKHIPLDHEYGGQLIVDDGIERSPVRTLSDEKFIDEMLGSIASEDHGHSNTHFMQPPSHALSPVGSHDARDGVTVTDSQAPQPAGVAEIPVQSGWLNSRHTYEYESPVNAPPNMHLGRPGVSNVTGVSSPRPGHIYDDDIYDFDETPNVYTSPVYGSSNRIPPAFDNDSVYDFEEAVSNPNPSSLPWRQQLERLNLDKGDEHK